MVKVVRTGATEVEAESVSHTAAYVPDSSIAKAYVGRTINGLTDHEIFNRAMIENLNVLLRGDTGSGKTLASAAFAAQVGAFYYSVPCDVSIEPSAFFGKRHPGDKQGEFPWIDGPVTQVVRGQCGLGDKCRDEDCISVLNISEINFMSPKISASLFPLLDSRRSLPLLARDGEVVRAHPRLLIVGDMNPGYRGTQPLNAAFANRFPVTIDWEYDVKVEKQLIKSQTLYNIVQKIRKMPDEITTPTGTNRLLEFERIARRFNLAFAVQNFLNGYVPEERSAIAKIMELDSSGLMRDFEPEKVKALVRPTDIHGDPIVGDEEDDEALPYFETIGNFEFSAEDSFAIPSKRRMTDREIHKLHRFDNEGIKITPYYKDELLLPLKEGMTLRERDV